MANRFSADPIPYEGAFHAPAGSVCVLVRNGMPGKIVPPGRKHRRLWGVPATGEIEIVQVNAGDVSIPVVVTDVLTKAESSAGLNSGWAFPRIDLWVTTRLSPADDYAALEKFVAGAGRDFGHRLEEELVTAVSERVYTAVSAEPMGRLRGNGLRECLALRDVELRSGLFQVLSWSITDTTEWPTGFLRAVEAEERVKIEPVEAQVQSQTDVARILAESFTQQTQDRVEHERNVTGVQYQNEIWEKRGLDPRWMNLQEHQEAHQRRLQELATTLIENAAGNPATVTRLQSEIRGLLEGAAGTSPAALHQPPHLVAGPGTAITGEVETSASPSVLGLNIDQKLLRRWPRTVPTIPAHQVLGLVSATTDACTVVLIALQDPRAAPADELEEFMNAVRGPGRGGSFQSMVVQGGSLDELVADWAARVVRPGLEDVDVGVVGWDGEDDEPVRIELVGEFESCLHLETHLKNPAHGEWPALQALLPVAAELAPAQP